MTRVALVHDWLVAHRGGEQVLLELARAFPSAPIYTLVYDPTDVHAELVARDIRVSLIQSLPGAPRHFRRYLPLFPRAIEAFDLSKYDVVLSTSHCVAKGVKTRGTHISYVHTPMRYLWDQLPTYIPPWADTPLTVKAVSLAVTPLRKWDVESAQRPTELIANSHYVAERIARVWGRASRVVHPPVTTDFFRQAPKRERQGYLVVSALVPYKRVEVAVAAAAQSGIQLTVIGQGPELGRLERIAKGKVRFMANASGKALREAYASAKALLFCGVEDFGIVPVEAQAAGCPVVALAKGGALETVVDGVTGVLFDSPEPRSLLAAMERAEALDFDRQTLENHAESFSARRFHRELQDVLKSHNVVYERPV